MKDDRYINLTTDFGFKRIFGTEMNKDLLIGFLNALFHGRHKIEDVTFKNNEHLGANGEERRAIFDVYCHTDKGSRIIVEMQNVYQQFYKDRSVYYASFPISEQARKGTWNYRLSPVYAVGILNFAFPEDKSDKRVRREVMLMDTGTNAVFYDKLAFIYVELAKFNKTEDELETVFDKWLFVLKNMQRLYERPAALQERVFQRLFKAAEIATYTTEEQREYEQSRRAYQDIKIAIDSVKKDWRKKGFSEGFSEGMEKGMEKGMEQGKTREREGIARKLLSMRMPLPSIAAATGLAEADIEALGKDGRREEED